MRAWVLGLTRRVASNGPTASELGTRRGGGGIVSGETDGERLAILDAWERCDVEVARRG